MKGINLIIRVHDIVNSFNKDFQFDNYKYYKHFNYKIIPERFTDSFYLVFFSIILVIPLFKF